MVAKIQAHDNSCGAASLLCAALELEIELIPQDPHYSLWIDETPLLNDDECETRIYQVTSDNPWGDDADANGWGYSLPSGIVRCATMLGLNARVIVYSTWSVRLLRWQYPLEITRLRNLNALEERGGSRSDLMPAQNEREIKVLVNRPGCNIRDLQLHYVMVRPNNQVMEPSQGINLLNNVVTKHRLNMHGTGISVLVSI
ncbi:MAG: hypothetical protein V4732_13780 [Pseudomonadota bacterium]